jgi:hypothetical protein
VGSVLHLYRLLGRTARMAVTGAVRIPSGGRHQIRWLTAVRHGRGGQPWWKEEVQNLEEKALHLLQRFIALVARLSKSTIGFQGQRANFRCTRP